jgi:hypothetical protein
MPPTRGVSQVIRRPAIGIGEKQQAVSFQPE